MLTYEEFKEELERVYKIKPDQFQREIASYIPQNAFDKLLDEMHENFEQNFGSQPAELLSTAYLTGLHTGWYIALKAVKKR
jgi:hypothetical protein